MEKGFILLIPMQAEVADVVIVFQFNDYILLFQKGSFL
jgi:hypothetical protein